MLGNRQPITCLISMCFVQSREKMSCVNISFSVWEKNVKCQQKMCQNFQKVSLSVLSLKSSKFTYLINDLEIVLNL